MKRFQIMMPEPLMKKIAKVAEEEGLAMSDIIRRACRRYFGGRVNPGYRYKKTYFDSPSENAISKHFEITGDKNDFIPTTDIIEILISENIIERHGRSASMMISAIMARIGANKSRNGAIRGYSGIRGSGK